LLSGPEGGEAKPESESPPRAGRRREYRRDRPLPISTR